MSDQAGSLPYLQLVMLSYQTCEELAGSAAVPAALATVAASEACILSMRLSSLVRFDRLAERASDRSGWLKHDRWWEAELRWGKGNAG